MTVQQENLDYDCGDGEPWALEYIRKLCRAHEAGRIRGGGVALRAKWQRARQTDAQLVPVLVRRASDLGNEERAVVGQVELRGDEDPAELLAKQHGWFDHRLVAMRGLARSRGVPLERVLRAAMRPGGLREVVEMPVANRPSEEESGQ